MFEMSCTKGIMCTSSHVVNSHTLSLERDSKISPQIQMPHNLS